MLSMRFVPDAEVAPEGVRRRKRVPLTVAFEVVKLEVVKLLVRVALLMGVNVPVALLLQDHVWVEKPPVVEAAA
jgi:hypothetical protein